MISKLFAISNLLLELSLLLKIQNIKHTGKYENNKINNITDAIKNQISMIMELPVIYVSGIFGGKWNNSVDWKKVY